MTVRICLAVSLWLLPFPAYAADAADLPVKEQTEKLSSGGKDIPVQVFTPSDKTGTLPVVVFLHGADGLQFEVWAKTYNGIARRVAARGYVVVLPHYFDRTDSKFGDLGTILKNYPAWSDTVKDTVTFAAKHPRADGTRVGVMGLSLGGTLAIDTAARDKRVKVLVDYFGGFPDVVAGQVKQLPPTLVLHGGKDKLVSVKDTEKLDKVLTDLKVPHETKIYPEQGHGFNGPDERDSVDRVVRFLDKHLMPAK
ncbi:MAG: dienelactone hydrolase [Gemmataceae bacterium]|nr:dienelactone hydrolase [Gemmataceae bacterium]